MKKGVQGRSDLQVARIVVIPLKLWRHDNIAPISLNDTVKEIEKQLAACASDLHWASKQLFMFKSRALETREI